MATETLGSAERWRRTLKKRNPCGCGRRAAKAQRGPGRDEAQGSDEPDKQDRQNGHPRAGACKARCVAYGPVGARGVHARKSRAGEVRIERVPGKKREHRTWVGCRTGCAGLRPCKSHRGYGSNGQPDPRAFVPVSCHLGERRSTQPSSHIVPQTRPSARRPALALQTKVCLAETLRYARGLQPSRDTRVANKGLFVGIRDLPFCFHCRQALAQSCRSVRRAEFFATGG